MLVGGLLQAACTCRTQALAQENPQDAVAGGWRYDAERAALSSVGLLAVADENGG